MTNIKHLEQELCAGYAEEARLYARALDLAEQASEQVGAGADGNPLLNEIADLLARVGVIEAETAGTREQWRRVGATPGAELRAHLGDVANLIQRMQSHLGQALDTAPRKKQALAPQLDELAQREKGHAYGFGFSADL
ncbi:MAG: hypothetical protein U0793_17870 [Gemmataceae bacterium]